MAKQFYYNVKWVAPQGKMVIAPLGIIQAKNMNSAIRIARKRTKSNAIFSIQRVNKK